MKKIKASGAKPTEAALRESEARTQLILNTALDAVVTMDRDGLITEWNIEAERIFGYARAEVLGQPLAEKIVPPASRAAHWAGLRRFLASGEGPLLGKRIEITVLRADGAEFPVELAITPIRHGGEIFFSAFVRDITERKQAEQALTQSLSLMRATLESTADGILVVNPEGKIETFNRTFVRMWRLPDDVLASKDDSRALQWVLDQLSEPQKFIEKVRYLYAHPSEESFDSLTFKDGRVFERYSRPQFIGGQVVGRVWSFRDITERKQAEAALRESEASFRALFEQAAVGVTRMETSTGRFLEVNRKYCEITGYSREELLQTNFQAISHPEELGEDLVNMGRMQAGEIREFTMPKRHVRKDGTLVWLELTVSAMWQPGEPPSHHIAVVQDITARRQTELALQRSQASITAIINSVDGIVWEADAQTFRFTFVSPRAERLLGYPVSRWIEEPAFWAEHIHPDDREYAVNYCMQCTREGRDHEFEYRMLAADGRVVRMRDIVTVVVENDRTVLLRGLMVDITKHKQLEEQLRQSQKMEAIGQLSGGVAHDLNNLLTVIKGHIGLLRAKGQVSAETAESVQQIDEAADRAANLTRQLLTFSRQQVMQPIVLNLNGVVINLTRMLRRLLSESIQMEVECVPQPLLIRADEGMVEQVLLNLVVNARDALPKSGTLRITTEPVDLDEPAARAMMQGRAGAYVCLAVSDTGTGIAPEILPRIFEPFFTTKGIGKGTGIGLATVYAIMHQHGGWINVESVVGRGSTFRAYFPRLAAALPATLAGQDSLPVRGGHEGVLLVEDESAVRVVAEAALVSLGYRVFTAPSGLAALQVWEAHRHEIDLLLTDLVMPEGITGRDLALRLRASAPQLAVIYMSGYSQEMAGGDFPLEEGTNFLPKPFELTGLAKLVRASLDRGATLPPFAHGPV